MRVNLRIIFIVITVICTLFVFINNYYDYNYVQIEDFYEKYEHLLNKKNEICNFDVDPYDPQILSYLTEPKNPIQCHPKQSNITFIDGKYLKLNDESVDCEYRYALHNSGVDDFTVKYTEWKKFESTSIELEHDFVDVKCTKLGFEFYRKQLATVVQKNRSIESGSEFIDETIEKPSVIIIGFDGLSKSNYIRQLKKSKEQMDKMGFILFDKYTKIADNTFPNWMGIFMGQHTYNYEFESTVDTRDHIDYDNWTELVWRKFGEKGYATLFAEDSPDINTFHYNRRQNGFIKKPPTDHYMRTLYLSWQDQKYLWMRSDLYCYDDMPVHQIHFNYLQRFLEEYQGTAKFLFSWMVDISHDYLGTISVADEDLKQFLIKNEKLFEKSIVILLSDHGNRYDKIRQTVIGRMESRLPVFSVRIPESIQKKYPEKYKILKENSKMLTSHFDTHATLMHILQGLNNAALKLPRGQSLFTEISSNRTCHEAEIPQVFCPCFKEISLDPTEGEEYAKILIDYINDYFKEKNVEDKCAKIELKSISSVILTVPPQKLTTEVHQPTLKSAMFNYRVQFIAKEPSNALLEGIVFKNQLTGEVTFSKDLDRNNKYGNTSHCVNDQLLKKTCHCL